MRTEIVRRSNVFIECTAHLDDSNLIPADLTGATLTCMVKDVAAKPDSSALLTKTVGSGITVIEAALGHFEIELTAANTDVDNKVLYFEVVAALADGTVIRTGTQTLYLTGNVKHE